MEAYMLICMYACSHMVLDAKTMRLEAVMRTCMHNNQGVHPCPYSERPARIAGTRIPADLEG